MADQKLYYDQDQIDTIRYWQQQMQEEELGGMGYENFVEKHGPVFASQVESVITNPPVRPVPDTSYVIPDES